MYEIENYITRSGKDVYLEWRRQLKDKRVNLSLDRRLLQLESGNFGDHKFCGDGIWELRIDLGPGYRIYYALAGKRLILLLCAGSKRSQSADIERAGIFWQEYRQRSVDEKPTS